MYNLAALGIPQPISVVLAAGSNQAAVGTVANLLIQLL
jgi:hypothetical protein